MAQSAKVAGNLAETKLNPVKKNLSPKRSPMCRVARTSLFARIADLVVDDPKAPRDLSSSPQHLEKYGRDRQSVVATRRAKAAAHQRVADLQKVSDDSDPPVWKRLHNNGVLKVRPDESVWPTGKTT